MTLKCLFDSVSQSYRLKEDSVLSVNPKKVSASNHGRWALITWAVPFPSEVNQLSPLRSYRGARKSIDVGVLRPMSTIVELSPDQAQMSSEDFGFLREGPRLSLTPLAQGKTCTNGRHESIAVMDYPLQGTLTSVFSSIIAMSKKNKANIVTVPELPEEEIQTTESTTSPEKYQ